MEPEWQSDCLPNQDLDVEQFKKFSFLTPAKTSWQQGHYFTVCVIGLYDEFFVLLQLELWRGKLESSELGHQ